MELIIKNPKILKFYQENPGIDIEESNLLLINLMENIFNKMSSQVSGNVNSQILSFLNENRSKMEKMNQNVEIMNQNVEQMKTDIIKSTMGELSGWKKEYFDETKLLLENQNLQSKEKIEGLLDKNTENVINKTNLLLNDVLPKSKTEDREVLKTMFQNLFSNFNEEVRKNMEKSGETGNLQRVLGEFETKYANLLQNIQQPLYATISSSEERLSQHLTALREHATESTGSQVKMFGELNEFLGKYKISSNRGKFGEHQLAELLTKMYPTGEIKNTSGTKASGDFMLFRQDKRAILFENKEYDQNVNKDEITKFHRDIDLQDMNGIFLSQYSGICFKDNFHIDIHKGNVLVYIHNCEYNPQLIKTAINIIDYLGSRIQNQNNNENFSIPGHVLDQINEEFKAFMDQKENIVQFAKEMNKKLLSQIDDLKMPNLEKYLEPKYANVKSRGFLCDICNNYTANTKQSLAAHKRGCARKHQIKNE